MWGMLKEGKIKLKVMDLCNECLLHGLLKDKAMPYLQGGPILEPSSDQMTIKIISCYMSSFTPVTSTNTNPKSDHTTFTMLLIETQESHITITAQSWNNRDDLLYKTSFQGRNNLFCTNLIGDMRKECPWLCLNVFKK